jgi:hypothetical protein
MKNKLKFRIESIGIILAFCVVFGAKEFMEKEMRRRFSHHDCSRDEETGKS